MQPDIHDDSNIGTRLYNVISQSQEGKTIHDLAIETNINRNTVAKYLDILCASHLIELKIVGKAKLYSRKKIVPEQNILNYTQDCIMKLNQDYKILEVNQSCQDNFGTVQLKGNQFNVLFPEIFKQIESYLRLYENNFCNIRCFQNNQKLHYLVKIIPTFSADSKLITLIFTDVTSTKKIIDLEEQKSQFSELFITISKLLSKNIKEKSSVVDDILAYSGKCMRADRSYVIEYVARKDLLNNTFEWCAEGISSEIENLQNMPAGQFPWTMKQLFANEIIRVNVVKDLPKEAANEREILEMQNIKSIVLVPLYFQNKLKGFVGFDFVKDYINIHDDLISTLQIMSNIIAQQIYD
jgi:hypothetical protein